MLLVFDKLIIVKDGFFLDSVNLVPHDVECLAEPFMLRAHLILEGSLLILELFEFPLHAVIGHAMLMLFLHDDLNFINLSENFLILLLEVGDLIGIGIRTINCVLKHRDY